MTCEIVSSPFDDEAFRQAVVASFHGRKARSYEDFGLVRDDQIKPDDCDREGIGDTDVPFDSPAAPVEAKKSPVSQFKGVGPNGSGISAALSPPSDPESEPSERPKRRFGHMGRR